METIVITGTNRGIGLELVRNFLNAGKRVLAGCREPAKAAALNALKNTGSLEVHALDVTDATSVASFCALAGRQPVDVLINNAGVWGGEHQGLADMDYAAWRHALEVNTIAPFRLAAALLPNLKQAARPRIVTVSSQMGAFNLKGMTTGAYAYRSSKAAVSKVMQTLAEELKPDGIIACPVHPGWVKTDMGGPDADLSASDSAAGLFRLIDQLTLAQSGCFWTWDGREHVW